MTGAGMTGAGVTGADAAGTTRFSDSAARLSGQCALLLGWRPDEFWSATPAELAAIRDALRGPESSARVSRAEVDRMMESENGR